MNNHFFSKCETLEYYSHEKSSLNSLFNPIKEYSIDYSIKSDLKGKFITIVAQVKQEIDNIETIVLENKCIFNLIAKPIKEDIEKIADECINYLNFDNNDEYIKPLITEDFKTTLTPFDFAIISSRYRTY